VPPTEGCRAPEGARCALVAACCTLAAACWALAAARCVLEDRVKALLARCR